MSLTVSCWIELPIDESAMLRCVPDMTRVASDLAPSGHLADADGQKDSKPTVTDGVLAFNGVAPDIGDPFIWPPSQEPSLTNGEKLAVIVNTRGFPYTIGVMACLLVAKAHLGAAAQVYADLPLQAWRYARDLAQESLGVPIPDPDAWDDS